MPDQAEDIQAGHVEPSRRDLPREDEGRRTALVTGATRGIGLEMSRVLAAEGWDLVLVARNEDELATRAEELEGDDRFAARIVAGDLSRPGEPRRIAQELKEARIEIHALVNNAGFGTYGPFAEQDLEGELEMIRVNAEAVTALTGLFLPGMLARGGGRILQVASTAAFQPGPLMATYYATKAFVLHFSEALAEELSGSGVTVTVLCPGPTRTSFQERAEMEESGLVQGLLPMMTPERVARAGYRGMMSGKRLVVPGIMNKLGVFSTRLAPRGLVAKLVGKVMEPT